MNRDKQHNWNAWYAAVLIALLLQVLLYYWFTQHWS